MSAIPAYFSDFLSNIRLTDALKAELISAHQTLRDRLDSDDLTKDLIVETFLQGSYARSTCIKPEPEKKVDVDVVAVTNIDHEFVSPKEAFSKFVPFVEKYYDDYQQQSRSIGISLPKVDVDLVITAAPNEEVKQAIQRTYLSSAFTVEDILKRDSNMIERYRLDSLGDFFNVDGNSDEWKSEPLLIPDYDKNIWFRTHPLAQIRWTAMKNKASNGHYINVVKAIKWWKRVALPNLKHPKSYPLERFIGECCPDRITSVGEGIVKSFETIALHYPHKPVLPDIGVPEHDVFSSLSDKEYAAFYSMVCKDVKIAKRAYESDDTEESVRLWRTFFRDSKEFPEFNGTPKGFTSRTQKTESMPTGRFG